MAVLGERGPGWVVGWVSFGVPGLYLVGRFVTGSSVWLILVMCH